jgi:hypothetical protein
MDVYDEFGNLIRDGNGEEDVSESESDEQDDINEEESGMTKEPLAQEESSETGIISIIILIICSNCTKI